MTIIFDPSKVLSRIAPATKIEELFKGNFSLKRSALSFVDKFDFLNKKDIATVALKVLKNYKSRPKEEKAEVKADPALLVQRVQNEVVTQIADEIKTKYQGEFYEWLPSDAEDPDPEHQLNYGKTFQVGDGEMPGDRYGCRCGMRILVKDSSLEL